MGMNGVNELNGFTDSKPSDSAIQELRSQVKGEIIVKGESSEAEYKAAIHRWNEGFIQEAVIIVFCESEEDVAASLLFVKKHKLEMTIACGRHSYMGASSTTGLVVDLSKMRKVTVDKANMSCTAQGGCLAKDLEEPLDDQDLSVVLGAVNETGIGGLTLGGGTGPLSGQYGQTVDNLLSARLVLADGTIKAVSADENADLFWAIRGGGSNFGVVTEFTYKVHNQGPVFFGMMAFDPSKTEAFLNLAHHYYPLIQEKKGKLTIFMAFTRMPGMPKVHGVCVSVYDGPEDEAREALKPLFDLEPLVNTTRMGRYKEVTVMAPGMDGPPTHQNFATSNALMVPPLDLDVIRTMLNDLDALFDKYSAAVAPSKVVFEIRNHSVTSSVPVNATALAGRDPAQLCAMDVQYDASQIDHKTARAEAQGMISKAREALKKKQQNGPLVGSGAYVNANIASGVDKAELLFGSNLPKLRELKAKYDPDFIFNKWHPIVPASR